MPTINKPKKQTTRTKTSNRRERNSIYTSARWKRIRQLKFMENPICEVCEGKGIATPAEDIHHIVSFVGIKNEAVKYELAYDYENLLSVCRACHSKLHHGYRWDKESKQLIK